MIYLLQNISLAYTNAPMFLGDGLSCSTSFSSFYSSKDFII
nr:hypothetical protein [Pedobacter glucosidilyticus]